ncbi:hypothetical protein [Streptomyces sp. MK5]|uniref:hypothetical protein n=1 Tax=Streptomyces sp. MK5 TaxID=3064253 RepID=UPI002741DF4E|nr:hypothetical protein [Streptomyces sp. MK5]
MQNEDARPTDSALVRELLWDSFPEQRGVILALEEEEREYASQVGQSPLEVGAYTLVSEVFIQEILEPLLEMDPPVDEQTAKRCARFLEFLLASGRRSIHEMTSIRVTDHLLGYPENWKKFRKYAGVLLLREVKERQRYYNEPFLE